MTAIVGYIDQAGDINLAGDTGGMLQSYSFTNMVGSKVFRNGPYLMGYTSSFRMGQVLEHSFIPPLPDIGAVCDMGFMVKRFIVKLRETFKDAGFASKDKEVEEGGIFLIGHRMNPNKRGVLYLIQADYSLIESVRPYNACGCGSELIMGSMFSTDFIIDDAKAKLHIALKAAAEFSGAVRGPFTFISASMTKPIQLEEDES